MPDKDCENYARECARLAAMTEDSYLREQLFEMARDWMAVVMHEDDRAAPPSQN